MFPDIDGAAREELCITQANSSNLIDVMFIGNEQKFFSTKIQLNLLWLVDEVLFVQLVI